jgi:MFS family permease
MRRSSHLGLLILLALGVGIAYMDRGGLAVAKPEVAAEFHLGPARMGLLFSAFFWSYAVCQFASGWVTDRFDPKSVYAAGFLLWSLATLAMGLTSGFAVFFGLRLLLGIGESVIYPASARLIVLNFAEERRGFVNGLIDAGSKAGPALSTLLGGLVVARYGWRALFLALAIASQVWLVCWLIGVRARKVSPGAAADRAATPRLRDLLRRREVWGTSLGMACLGFVWSFLVSWLPAYLQEARGYSKASMALLGSLPFWAMGLSSVTSGWVSDRWIAAGGSPTRVRKTFVIAGFVLCAAFLYPASLAKDPGVCVALLIAACIALGFYSSNVWAITQTLAGPHAAGQWTGVQNAIGNLGAVVAPALAGWLVQATGTYHAAFAVASLMPLLGVVFYFTLVGPVVPLHFAPRPALAPSL